MTNKSDNVLGYIELETGAKAVSPLNDIFLNFTFGQEAYWETLREIVNIFYKDYIRSHQDTNVTLIEGKVVVKTEFPQYRSLKSTKPKKQDIKIESEEKIDYIDFQNDTHPALPIEVRSIEYFGFSLTRGKEKKAAHLWLLNGAVAKLLQGNIYSNYILMDEKTYYQHPNATNILYVDLKRLAKTDCQAGELAGVLIGTIKTPKDSKVNLILQSLRESFDTFRIDTEVRHIMTRKEFIEANAEARAKARAEEKLLPLIAEKDEQIAVKDEQLVEQEKRIKELEALLANKANSR